MVRKQIGNKQITKNTEIELEKHQNCVMTQTNYW